MTRPRVRASYEATLAHPAAAVWRYFDWPNLELMRTGGFFAEIEYGEREPISGATRLIRLGSGPGNGGAIREVLELSDSTTMQLRYRILDPSPMPIEQYRGEVRVRPTDASNCIVQFSSECVLNGIDTPSWRETYSAMQRANIDFVDRALAN